MYVENEPTDCSCQHIHRSWSLVFNIVHKGLGLGVYKTAVISAFFMYWLHLTSVRSTVCMCCNVCYCGCSVSLLISNYYYCTTICLFATPSAMHTATKSTNCSASVLYICIYPSALFSKRYCVIIYCWYKLQYRTLYQNRITISTPNAEPCTAVWNVPLLKTVEMTGATATSVMYLKKYWFRNCDISPAVLSFKRSTDAVKVYCNCPVKLWQRTHGRRTLYHAQLFETYCFSYNCSNVWCNCDNCNISKTWHTHMLAQRLW